MFPDNDSLVVERDYVFSAYSTLLQEIRSLESKAPSVLEIE